MRSPPIFTIGHSNRTLEAFLALLQTNAIDRVVDVRSAPSSRAMPQFNGPPLATSLGEAGIEYRHAPRLGGHRGASLVPAEVNAFWQHRAFHHYADYALGAPFAEALQALVDESAACRCVIMCAEAVWWRCHRRIVTDYLLARGLDVRHILSPTKTIEAKMSDGAKPQSDGRILYPATDHGTDP